MRRKFVGRPNRNSFSKSADRTRGLNLAPPPMRGGFRI